MSVTIALKSVTNRPIFIIIPKIKNFKCFVRYFANLTVLSPQKNPLGFWVAKPKANLNKTGLCSATLSKARSVGHRSAMHALACVHLRIVSQKLRFCARTSCLLTKATVLYAKLRFAAEGLQPKVCTALTKATLL